MRAWGCVRSRFAVPLGVAVLLAVAPGCATLAPAPLVVPVGGDAHAGEHFTIVCHFPCGSAGSRALRSAELTWRLSSRLLDAEAPVRASRPIHLYRTEQEYEEVEAELTGGRFRLNRAMTYRGTEAHISVHPNLSTTALREFGLTANTLRVIAHEAAHMALRALEPRTRDLPDWLDEGMASSLELDVLIEMDQADTRLDEPVSSTRLYLLRERIRREAMPPLADLLEGREAGLTLAERYAFYQHFMDFLRTGPYRDRLERVLQTLGTRQGSTTQLRRDLIVGILGAEPEALGSADAAFRSWLMSREPGWVQARRALSTAGSHWVQVGFDSGAEAWRWTPAAEPPYRLSGGVRVLERETGTAAILVGLAGSARLAVVFAPGELRLERLRYAGDPSPEVLARRTQAERRGAALPFRLDVDVDGVTATVDGAAAVRVDLPTAPRWGLAAGPGANVVWSDIAVDAPRTR